MKYVFWGDGPLHKFSKATFLKTLFKFNTRFILIFPGRNSLIEWTDREFWGLELDMKYHIMYDFRTFLHLRLLTHVVDFFKVVDSCRIFFEKTV